MAFVVQQRRPMFGAGPDEYHTFAVRQDEPGRYDCNPFSLHWERVGAGTKRRKGIPLHPETIIYLLGGITPAEAEAITGIPAPICFDKLMDLM